MSITNFVLPGFASFIIGGQWGSEGKGAAAAFVASELNKQALGQIDLQMLDVIGDHKEPKFFDIVTTNAGAQAGHTSDHAGKRRVVFHLPTYSLIADRKPLVYLNAGSIIDPAGLGREISEHHQSLAGGFVAHPNAAIITPECVRAENEDTSAQTKIASTRKGVGEALSRKILRTGNVAGKWQATRNGSALYHIGTDIEPVPSTPERIPDLNALMRDGKSVLVEVPQGVSLSVDSRFYPYVTSRNCTVGQAMSDAGIHPHFYGASMLVLRTFPIRVGNIEHHYPNVPERGGRILGTSGPCYPDQEETSWEALDRAVEITTVTKRPRRVFTFSEMQARESIALTRPNIIYLTFCDYFKRGLEVHRLVDKLLSICAEMGGEPHVYGQYGPTTDDTVLLHKSSKVKK